MPLKGLQPEEDPCQSTGRSEKEHVAERTYHVLTAALPSHSLSSWMDRVSLNTHISNYIFMSIVINYCINVLIFPSWVCFAHKSNWQVISLSLFLWSFLTLILPIPSSVLLRQGQWVSGCTNKYITNSYEFKPAVDAAEKYTMKCFY